MVDQFAVVPFTSPAVSNTTLDITTNLITETFSAGIFLFSRSTTDDNNNAHGVMGIGFIAPDGFAADAARNRGLGIQIEDTGTSGVASPNNNTRHYQGEAIIASDGLFNDSTTEDIVGHFTNSIAGGVRLRFTKTDVQTKGVALLMAGLNRASVDDIHILLSPTDKQVGNSANGGFYRPDAVLFTGSDSSANADHQDACPNLGFALDKAGVPQISAYVNMDDATEPTDADGFVNTASAWGSFVARSRQTPAVTQFQSDGFRADNNTSSPQANYLALKFSQVRAFTVKNLSVAASSGNQAFTGFGFKPKVVVGIATLLTSTDTVVDGATASTACYFMFSEANARAYAVHFQEGVTIPIGGLTNTANTRQGNYAVLMLNSTGTVVQQATLVSMDSDGFTLNFSTGSAAGTLTVFAIGPAGISSSETEQITDGHVFVLGAGSVGPIVANETVQITDSQLNNGVRLLEDSTNDQYGSIFQAGAVRGTGYAAGVAAGGVF